MPAQIVTNQTEPEFTEICLSANGRLPEASALKDTMRQHFLKIAPLFNETGHDSNSVHVDVYANVADFTYVNDTSVNDGKELLRVAGELATDCADKWKDVHDFTFCVSLMDTFLNHQGFFTHPEFSSRSSVLSHCQKLVKTIHTQLIQRAGEIKTHSNPVLAERTYLLFSTATARLDSIVSTNLSLINKAGSRFSGGYDFMAD